MALPLLCDEHVPYPVVEGLRRRGLDILTVQEIGLRSTADEQILETARRQRRIVYTQDADFLEDVPILVETTQAPIVIFDAENIPLCSVSQTTQGA